MQPIHELLSRIQWDPEFGLGKFELAFLDHLEQELVRLPFTRIQFVPGDHYFFHYLDEEGVEHSVPFHRIKAVYKDGALIRQRTH